MKVEEILTPTKKKKIITIPKSFKKHQKELIIKEMSLIKKSKSKDDLNNLIKENNQNVQKIGLKVWPIKQKKLFDNISLQNLDEAFNEVGTQMNEYRKWNLLSTATDKSNSKKAKTYQ